MSVRRPAAEVHELIVGALRAAGCDHANATAVADTLVAAERDGATSHGLFRLPGYLASLRSGKVNGHADPTVEWIAPAVLRVDGDGGFAPLALERSRAPLVAAARQQGVAMCGIVDTYHFAALWPEVEALADSGLCAIAATSFKPMVAPAGSTRPLFGTNPMAFAWPRPDGPPMVFDQASAAMARGEIMLAAQAGRPVPEGVGLDRHGAPTTDPSAILDGGVQLPFGGYKGSAVALMIELLAGPLIGELCSFEAAGRDNDDGGPARGGEFLLALDPGRGDDPAGWLAHGEALFTELLGHDGARLPGDRRYANRRRSDGTITVDDAMWSLLREHLG